MLSPVPLSRDCLIPFSWIFIVCERLSYYYCSRTAAVISFYKLIQCEKHLNNLQLDLSVFL